MLGCVWIATGVVVLEAEFQVFGETGIKMGLGTFRAKDVDVKETGFHDVPCPPSLLRNYSATAFATPGVPSRSSSRQGRTKADRGVGI